VKNLGLNAGDQVDLWGNPLGPESCSFLVPALRNRGVEVFDDCGNP